MESARKLENFGVSSTSEKEFDGVFIAEGEIAGKPDRLYVDATNQMLWITAGTEAAQQAFFIETAALPVGFIDHLKLAATTGKGVPVHSLTDEPEDIPSPEGSEPS